MPHAAIILLVIYYVYLFVINPISFSRFQRKHDYDDHFIKAHVFRKPTAAAAAAAAAAPAAPSTVSSSHNSAFSPPSAAKQPVANAESADKVLLYQCPFCVNLFPSQSVLTQHITGAHAGKEMMPKYAKISQIMPNYAAKLCQIRPTQNL
jgi:uncharacterized C2H2 Zn-finger protein